MTNTFHDRRLQELAKLAIAQGWRIEFNGNKATWFPRDGRRAPVFTNIRVSESGNQSLVNLLASLRRAGLNIQPQPEPEPAPEEPVPPDAFVRDLAGLIEEEIQRRTRNLTDQVEALKRDNDDLRDRLAEAEHDVEERARRAAQQAVEELLAARRVVR